MTTKPLGHKSYGSIPHLPGSRRGPGDHGLNDGQARICLEKCRTGDRIIVQEKLDGSNVSIANIDGEIVALGRAGWPAQTSPWEQHQLFAAWVRDVAKIHMWDYLPEGWRICGEWLAQAHGTKYSNIDHPFVAFDLMRGTERAPYALFEAVAERMEVDYLCAVHIGGPLPIDDAMELVNIADGWDAEGGPEGAIWRVENGAHVDFVAKYVRPDKVDGKYLPEISGEDAVWNWRPSGVTQ